VSKSAYLGLGSNVGGRENNLRRAVEAIAAPDLRIARLSPVYETEPVEFTEQGWFLNQVIEIDTELFPMQLLTRLTRVERRLGRVRTIPKGPRIIDIDILFFGRAVVRTAKLEIPHPAIAARRFVLAPLADLAPDLRHPVTRKTVREMLAVAPAAKIVPYLSKRATRS